MDVCCLLFAFFFSRVNTYIPTKLLSSTCVMFLAGSLGVQGSCRQSKAGQLGGHDGPGKQKRDITIDAGWAALSHAE